MDIDERKVGEYRALMGAQEIRAANMLNFDDWRDVFGSTVKELFFDKYNNCLTEEEFNKKHGIKKDKHGHIISWK